METKVPAAAAATSEALAAGSISAADETDGEKRPGSSQQAVMTTGTEADSSSSDGVPLERTVTEKDPHYLSGLPLFAIIGSVTLVAFLMMLDTSILATAIPRITDEFHSLQDVGWYGSAYQLANAALQPLTGKIYSKFSIKWCFLVFFGLFELGSLLCGVATSSTMLIVGRAVAGMGSSGLMNGAMTIIANVVPLQRRPSLTGFMIGFSQMGIITGPLVGGALTEYSTWRWCFYLNLPIGAVVAVFLAMLKIPDHIEKPPAMSVLPNLHHELDLLGFALFAPAAIQLLLALQYGGSEYAWNSATVIGLFCGAGATFLAWLAWDWHKGDNALIPLRMIKKRAVWSGSSVQFTLMSTMFTAAYFMPIYFQAIKGVSPSMSGVYLLPSILTQLIFGVGSGVLVERTGYVVPYSLVGGALASISSGLFSLFNADTTAGQWIGYQILNGAGRGCALQMQSIAIQTTLTAAEISIALAFLMFAQMLGAAITLVIANTIFNQSLRSELTTQAPNVNPALVIEAGATGFRSVVGEQDLPGVLLAYANSVSRVWYLAAAMGALAFFFASFMPWTDLRKKKKAAAGAEQA